MLRPRLSLAALTLIIAALGASPFVAHSGAVRSAAAAPPNPILFTTDRHGAAEIYSIRPDGAGATRITNNTCNDTDVSWSADGQRILFSSDCAGDYDIYSMNPDGTDRRRLTTDPRPEHLPAQSRDGQRIAFILEEAAAQTHLYVMNSDGSGAHRITQTAGVEENRPAWSPDGQRIAYCSTASGSYRVWIVNADGSDPVQITTSNSGAPNWSWTTNTIVYHGLKSIHTVNPDGTNPQIITTAADWWPFWSPDGGQIVFQRHGANIEIYLMNADGSGLRNLTNAAGNDSVPAWAWPQTLVNPDAAVEAVFAIAASASTQDEADALCNRIEGVVAGLREGGLTVRYQVLGITEKRGCATDTVQGIVPGGTVDHPLDWGPAIVDLARWYHWRDGYTRLIIPVADAGPENGSPVEDPGADRDAVNLAVQVAASRAVIVSPIQGNDPVASALAPQGAPPGVEQLMRDTATGTGGTYSHLVDPTNDIGGAVSSAASTASFTPVILGLLPDCDVAPAASVTVEGQNFQSGAAVQYRAVGTWLPAPGVTVLSAGRIRFTAPASLGYYEARVVNPNGLASGGVKFGVGPNTCGAVCPAVRIYTSDADFDEGQLVNVNHDTPAHNQIQLNPKVMPLPFIWIAASSRGTVLRLNTETGAILGEYLSAPDGRARNPSRTTVDLNGNVWVGNRDEAGGGRGSVVRIGLRENGQCVDRNGNGVIDTSKGLGDIRTWPNTGSVDSNGGVSTAADECIIDYVRVNGTNVRTVAVDRNNNVWIGGYGNHVHDLLDTTTKAIVRTIYPACGGYGGLLDSKGVLWSADSGSGRLLRFDPASGDQRCISVPGGYGLGVDSAGYIWHSQYGYGMVVKLRPDGSTEGAFATGVSSPTGLAVRVMDNSVWLANRSHSNVTRLASNGTVIATIPVGNSPTGASVDAVGKVWVTNLSDNTAMRIDPATNKVDLTVSLGAGAGPYNYSDMTGSVILGNPPQGKWLATYDSWEPLTGWGTIAWHSDEPAGTRIRVRVRSAENRVDLGDQPWHEVSNGVLFADVPAGRYLQVEAQLTGTEAGATPILYDLSVAPGCQAPPELTPTPTATPTATPTTTPTPSPSPTPTCTPSPTPPPGVPVVTDVRSCYTGSYFLAGVWAPNRYDATVDWQSLRPAHVDFALNGRTSAEGYVQNPTSHVYNMGTDLRYGVFGVRNELAVTAVAALGQTSPAYTAYPVGVLRPPWLFVNPTVLNPACIGKTLAFGVKILYPDPPFTGKVSLPQGIPAVGGHPFGLKDTQVSLELEGRSDGTGALDIAGETGFTAAGQEVLGKAHGEGEFRIEEGGGLQVTDASLGLGVSGELKGETPLLDLICKAFTAGACPLKEAENLPVIGGVIAWFNDKARVELKVSPEVGVDANFESTPDGWRWKGLTGDISVEMMLSMILDVMKDALSATVYGGGEPSMTLQAPPDPSYLKELAFKLFGGVKWTVWRFSEEYEVSYTWDYQPGELRTAAPELATVWGRASGWHIMPRDYAAAPERYATFLGNSPSAGAWTAAGDDGAPTSELLLASNVFPESHPALATGPQLLLLWVHDDTAKPLMQGEEIRYSTFSNGAWTTPGGITNDRQQDFQPQVAYDLNGKAVAVWQRNRQVQTDQTQLDAAYANAFELAYSTWSGQNWTTPAYLTNDAALDHGAVLARGQDGRLLLVWRRNPGGALVGTADNPDGFLWRTWDGATWSTGAALPSVDGAVLTMAAARLDGRDMAVVYLVDRDGDLASTDDRELVLTRFSGTAWSAPRRLTFDGQSDSHPSLFYDPNGGLRLVWLKGDTLYALAGDLVGAPRALVAAGGRALSQASAQAPDGDLVVMWQDSQAEGADIHYLTYDHATDDYSLVRVLTQDTAVEKFMAPAYTADGEVIVAYGKDALVRRSIVVSPTLTIPNVTTIGESNLYVARHRPGVDLAVAPGSIRIDQGLTPPGSSVRLNATVANRGDMPITAAQVAFYLGDPAAGGSLIGTRTVGVRLSGGMTTTVGLDWQLPAGVAGIDAGGPVLVYAVADPEGRIAEWDEANQEMGYVTGPDLAVGWMEVAYGVNGDVSLSVPIVNRAQVASLTVPLVLRLDDATTGPTVASAAVPPLAAGASTTLQLTWNGATASAGWHKLFAVVDPGQTTYDMDRSNNQGWTSAGLLADPAIDPASVTWQSGPAGTTITFELTNLGNRAATHILVGLYSRLPDRQLAPLTSVELDLAAGQTRTVILGLTGAVPGFYAAVNADVRVQERDISNNVVRVGRPMQQVYLPLVVRK